MLVLSRKKGERVLIGGGIEIVVIEVQGKRVRLGFNAPGEVAIHREEVWERLNDVQPAHRAMTNNMPNALSIIS